ncbi:hypothetical protein HBI56_027320 [Parastagonospora nodorum]|nr:hypothetical protein HBH53_031870 [Parastagonospora nodorum]KAH4006534.1 hypothetical protein HBI10_019300 [Parastagonospora nodorum]KAH4015319.1 hypothetical protein HBI13_161340 [Parastagonospora nodorum]KAH4025413.1 hypothetical protein HBI09_153160 [Parastagonospora nodorum]KAH4075065.1 hypothetical protein HBH50_033450 [Parastagonospora nodorum]
MRGIRSAWLRTGVHYFDNPMESDRGLYYPTSCWQMRTPVWQHVVRAPKVICCFVQGRLIELPKMRSRM